MDKCTKRLKIDIEEILKSKGVRKAPRLLIKLLKRIIHQDELNELLSECAGSLGMVGGQVLDVMSEERELTEQEVLDIQSRKTGKLISIACCLGVLAAGGLRHRPFLRVLLIFRKEAPG